MNKQRKATYIKLVQESYYWLEIVLKSWNWMHCWRLPKACLFIATRNRLLFTVDHGYSRLSMVSRADDQIFDSRRDQSLVIKQEADYYSVKLINVICQTVSGQIFDILVYNRQVLLTWKKWKKRIWMNSRDYMWSNHLQLNHRENLIAQLKIK